MAVEVRAACRDLGTQWMVFLCAGIYLVTFTLLAKRLSSSGQESAPTSRIIEPTHVGCYGILTNPDVWLCGFLLIVALTYAFEYGKAAASLQPLLLLFGAAFGKGVAVWTVWGNPKSQRQEAEMNRIKPGEPSRRGWFPSLASVEMVRTRLVLSILVLLLAGAALWQPETRIMEYQYRGERRWSGAWDNPNIYGILMAVGMVLAVGLLIQSLSNSERHLTPALSPDEAERESNFQRSSPARRWLRWLKMPALAGAAGLCGLGLFKSYSRGAWFGAAVGIAYLVWRRVRSPQPTVHSRSCVSWMRDNLCPLSVVLLSVAVLSFWQFRNTEWPPAQRVFSVANVNDFSWRNRVTAWAATLRMMADRPLTGFGWGKAEEAYRKDYSSPRLAETAAIQMNDYLMLGISTGIPALLCFLMYIGLCLKRRETGETRCPTQACRAGAIVLLVGFWFDGGLFKLPTAVLFWTLLELGRLEAAGAWTALSASGEAHGRADKAVRAPCRKLTRPQIGIRWTAGILATAALGWTAFHLVTPRLAVSERTLSIARRFMVQPNQKGDFDFLTSKPAPGPSQEGSLWRGKPLRILLEHLELAGYNRELVNWKLDDQIYREFVLAPQIDPAFDGDMNWRRPLWEYFYPRVRRETDPQAAAETVIKELRESVTIDADSADSGDIITMWNRGSADTAGVEALYVAALRSAGVPARLTGSHQTELFTGTEWKLAPRLLP